ncbi:MAG: dienelactone hydrolase family protein [Clostridia bacterium]|nr:dienelactone hydrolase family protein [Clostridia bacterium]
MKRLAACFLIATLLLAVPALSEKGHFVRHAKRDGKTDLLITYYVYEPPELTEGMPLVIYLHGSSERGDNALGNSLPLFIKNGDVLCDHTLLLVPQLPQALTRWSYVEETLMEIIREVIGRYGADESRIALVGYSLGGLGVWDLAGHYPGRFTRVMPVAGRINDEIFIDAFEMCQLKTFVGTKDETVDPKTAIEFTQALIEAGYDAELFQLEATHSQMPHRVFKNEEALAWIWMEKGNKKK